MVDPVCFRDLPEGVPIWEADFRGQRYNFCCARCKELFLADPEAFTGMRRGKLMPVPF